MLFHSRTYFVLLTLVLVAALSGAVHAAVVGVSPASTNATVGDTLLLTVGVDQVNDLGGFQFNFNYDPAALSVNTVTVSGGFDLPVKNQYVNTTGKGIVAAAVFSSPTGSGVNLPLAVISFTVKSSGTTSVGLANVILGKIGGAEILSTSVGATVSAAPGAGGPAVTLVSPLNGASAVPVNAAVTAYFSVPMNSSTINTASFLLTGPSGAVDGSVTASGQTATFTPSSLLASLATYTATITLGAQDLVGNTLASPYSWSFTTESTAVVTPPDTSITANPVNPSNSTSASFSFTSTKAGSTFECSLDGSAFAACSSPALYSSLTETGHIFAVRATDSAGNSDPTPATFSWVVDVTNPAFSLLSPADNSRINTTQVGYTLSETVTSGGIIFTGVTGTDSGSPHVYTMTTGTAGDAGAGSHAVNTGLPLVSGSTYDITFIAVDAAGNSGSAAVTGVTFDSTPALVAIDSPLSSSFTNIASVGYTLSEPLQSATLVFASVSSSLDPNPPYTYPLTGSELNAGSHTATTGISLKNGAVYDIAIQGIVDLAGNTTAAVVNTNITFDITAVAATNVKPDIKSIITTPTIGYTLSEDALSGTVTFTRTGGKPDNGSPHVSTLTSEDLTAGGHSFNTGLPLVQGTFYTVTFQFLDKAGNPATTVSTGMIFFDPDFGVGPVGNVDNSDGLNIVNNTDVLKLQAAMGARPGDRNWNPVCDLDRNNVIDIRDLMILHSHFGQTGP
jgi:hypothetical protein